MCQIYVNPRKEEAESVPPNESVPPCMNTPNERDDGIG